jgi:nucleotide-binding universal stress UspA family protein
MVDRCPSGALSYEIDDQENEPDLPIEIAVVDDGPLWLTGGIPIRRSDGERIETRNRLTLCRCGKSRNKPLCDGSHAQAEHAGAAAASEKEPPTEVTFGRIVAAVEQGEESEVVGVAAYLAASGISELDILCSGSDSDAGAVLRLAGAAGLSADRLSTSARRRLSADTVTETAEEFDAGLIVVERGGNRPSHLVHQVARHAPCDLLVVGDHHHSKTRPYRRVAIATDGSATADRAARRGYHVARTLGASVDLIFVGHRATGKLITTDTIAVNGSDVATRVHLLEGDPAKQILEAVRANRSDLVVVGNKGLTGVRGAVLGSVPKSVLDGAAVDVLVCRTVRQIASRLEPGEGGIIDRHGERLAAYKDGEGEVHLMSARCTHLGCMVEWNGTDARFDCPCHGSSFGPTGEVLNGPATRPLPPA